MYIRKAEKKDIPQIEELLYQVAKVHADARPDLFRAGQKKYTAQELEQMMQDESRSIYVAEQDERILGYAFCIFQENNSNLMTDIRTLYIDDLCVQEDARGENIGRQIYDYVLDIARQSGCYNVTLNVWECNPVAKKFYEKCGLQVQKTGLEKIL